MLDDGLGRLEKSGSDGMNLASLWLFEFVQWHSRHPVESLGTCSCVVAVGLFSFTCSFIYRVSASV